MSASTFYYEVQQAIHGARAPEYPGLLSREEEKMTTPPPPQPSAGWYPDPTGKPEQMYWDGERWHTTGPVPPKQRTRIRIQPTKANLIKGIVGVGLLVWLVAYNVPGFMGWVHKHQHPSGGTAQTSVTVDSSGSSAPSTSPSQSQSPYYQEGYNSGTSGLARNGYGDDMYNTGATVAEMEHNACSAAINNESNNASINDADQPGNQDDYMNGCLNAFRDHPPAAKPKPGPLNPYR